MPGFPRNRSTVADVPPLCSDRPGFQVSAGLVTATSTPGDLHTQRTPSPLASLRVQTPAPRAGQAATSVHGHRPLAAGWPFRCLWVGGAEWQGRRQPHAAPRRGRAEAPPAPAAGLPRTRHGGAPGSVAERGAGYLAAADGPAPAGSSGVNSQPLSGPWKKADNPIGMLVRKMNFQRVAHRRSLTVVDK